MDYAENYERCCKERVTFVQRHFMGILSRKARVLGQNNHTMWSLKYVIDTYFDQANSLRVMDCGAWDGRFLSYDTPVIRQCIALDFDSTFAPQLHDSGMDFILEHLKQYRDHFLPLRLRLSALQSLALSGCLGCTSATATLPNEFGAGTSGLVLAPTTTSEWAQFYLKCFSRHGAWGFARHLELALLPRNAG